MLDIRTIEWMGTPNFTPGRTQVINTIVIHWIVGSLSVADKVFLNNKSKVSAHYGVEDNAIHQYVKEQDTAWHAKSANPFSIGIEHSAQPGRDASEITLATSAELIADICQRYKLDPMTAIQPHSKYVQTECPGTMDIGFLRLRSSEIIKNTKYV